MYWQLTFWQYLLVCKTVLAISQDYYGWPGHTCCYCSLVVPLHAHRGCVRREFACDACVTLYCSVIALYCRWLKSSWRRWVMITRAPLQISLILRVGFWTKAWNWGTTARMPMLVFGPLHGSNLGDIVAQIVRNVWKQCIESCRHIFVAHRHLSGQ